MNATRLCFFTAGLLVAGLAAANPRVTIVSADELATQWTPDPAVQKVVAGYPSNAIDKSHDVCVTIGYEIGEDGKTSGFNELNSWTSGTEDGAATPAEVTPYSQISAAVVSRYHYVPVGKAKKVFTSATFAFDGSKKVGEAAIRSHCEISNLKDYVAQLKSKKNDKGDLETENLRRHRNATDSDIIRAEGRY